MKEKIRLFAKSLGITEFGVALTSENKTVLVFLFPYYCGNLKGNISLYARSSDYHLVVKKYLEKIALYIKSFKTNISYEIYCDNNSLCERELAYTAGLGFYGNNRMLINPTYGSYFFIGCIMCDGLMLKADMPLDKKCLGCGMCIKSCPGGAILKNGFDITKCASELSQKKGVLTEAEKQIILKSGLLWGCDICQNVCPHNKNVKITPISEFKENLILSLPEDDIANLSGRAFLKKYADRAFTWRGKNVLLRNIKINENRKDIKYGD